MSYPVPSVVRIFGKTKGTCRLRALVLVFGLLSTAYVFDRVLNLGAVLPCPIVFAMLWVAAISFGLWSVAHMYIRTKEDIEQLGLSHRLNSCLRQIYSDRAILLWAFGFAFFITLVHLQLKLQLRTNILCYISAWTFFSGFVAGVGFRTAIGSTRLARALARENLDLLVLTPMESPAIQRLSALMWMYTFLFIVEVILFGISISLAGFSLKGKIQGFAGFGFTGLEVAGATVFFFLAIFAPMYGIFLQRSVWALAKSSQQQTLERVNHRFDALLKKEDSDPKALSELSRLADAIQKTPLLPLSIEKTSGFLSVLLPALAYLYHQNAEIIQKLVQSLVKALFPSIHP